MEPLRRNILWIALLLGLASCTVSSWAVTPQVWAKSNQSSFEPGRFEHLSLSDTGDLLPAPVPELLFDGEGETFVWSIAQSVSGELFAGTAPRGKVWRRSKEGKWKSALDTGDIAVTALALGPDGTLYAASIPGGLIHVLPPGGAPGKPMATGERYVWAMAFDGKGDLLVATGLRARVLRFRGGRGLPETLLESSEEHILCLLPERDGSILAGSAGHGLLYRLPPPKHDPAPKPLPARPPVAEILADLPQEEIRALVRIRETVYLAAVTGLKTFPVSKPPATPPPTSPAAPPVQKAKPEPTSAPAAPPAPPAAVDNFLRRALGSIGRAPLSASPGGRPTEPARTDLSSAPPPPKPEPIPPAPNPPRSAPRFNRSASASQAVYALAPTGVASPVFSSDQEVLLSLAPLPGDALAIGTGNGGLLFRLDPGGSITRWLNVEESQLLCLLPMADGSLLAGTGNPGRLYRIDPRRTPGGTLTTEPLDAQQPARWGRLSWRSRGGGKVLVAIRTGSSEKPDATWSDWSPPLSVPEGTPVSSPATRYLQARIDLKHEAAKGDPPVFESLKLVYLPRNAPPSIEAFDVATPPAEVYSEHKEPSIRERDRMAEIAKKRPMSFVRRIRWEASDPNRDRLWAALAYRGEGEREWKPMFSEPTLANDAEWDTRTVPDGSYTVRLTVGDSWSNPAGSEFTATRESDRFTVDNTPPVLSNLAWRADGPGRVVATASAEDGLSNVSTFETLLDSGDWLPAPVNEGLADSRRESMELPLTGLAMGEHTLAVRVRDEAGNSVTGKLVFDLK